MPLRRFNTTEIARLNRIYENAGRRIRTILRRVEPENYSDELAETIRGEIKRSVELLNRMSMDWSERAIASAYARGERTARTIVRALRFKPARELKFDHKRKMADDLAVTLIRANNSIIKTSNRYLAVMAMASARVATVAASVTEYDYTDDAKKRIDRWAEQTVRNEQSRKTLAKKISDYMRRFIDADELIEVGNRLYNVKSYSEMLSRTTMREAQTAATLDVCDQFDCDLVQFSEHNTECEICKPYENEIYSISGKHPVYEKLGEQPPLHPNCEHSLLPTSDIAIASEKKFGLYQTTGRK